MLASPHRRHGLAVALSALVLVGCRDRDDSAAEPTTTQTMTSNATPATDGATDDATGSTGTEDRPFALDFVEIPLPGDWRMITDFAFLPGPDQGELLLLDRQGRVGHLVLEGDEVTLLGEFTVPGIWEDLDCGLLAVAFDPDFVDNGYLYLGGCTSQHFNAIQRVVFDPTNYGGIADSAQTILQAGDLDAPRPWHNIGSIGFDADGYLWAVFGDKRLPEHSQDLGSDLGALVRVKPTPDGHEPAPDNPFVDQPDASPNVYAYGLRSPWRALLDSRGRWWFGDVGSDHVEEINVVSAPGQNFGWPLAEGQCSSGCDGLVDPVVSWPHDGVHDYAAQDDEVSPTQARVAWVGLEVLPEIDDPYAGHLDGKVLFGDYCQGWVRALDVDDSGAVVSDEHLGHLRFPVAWRRGPDGFVYAATFGRCETPNIDPADPPKGRLYRAVWP